LHQYQKRQIAKVIKKVEEKFAGGSCLNVLYEFLIINSKQNATGYFECKDNKFGRTMI